MSLCPDLKGVAMTIKAKAWHKKKKQITPEYREGIEVVERARNEKCPNCNAFISEGDRECWVCKKELDNG